MTLTVTGAGFTPASVARREGSDQATTYVRSLAVTAVLPASDVDRLGRFAVTVYDASRGLESDPATFTMVPVLRYTYLPVILR